MYAYASEWTAGAVRHKFPHLIIQIESGCGHIAYDTIHWIFWGDPDMFDLHSDKQGCGTWGAYNLVWYIWTKSTSLHSLPAINHCISDKPIMALPSMLQVNGVKYEILKGDGDKTKGSDQHDNKECRYWVLTIFVAFTSPNPKTCASKQSSLTRKS